MRCLLISLIGFLTAVQALNATAQDQPSSTVTAKVVNDQGDPVDYATVQMRDQRTAPASSEQSPMRTENSN